MALIKSTLELDLRELMDPDYSGFTSFPATIQEMSARWSTTINNYASLVTPPSTTSVAARSSLQSILNGVDPNAQNGIALLISGLTSYATVLATGMLPAFTGVPPPIPIVLTAMSAAGLAGASGEVTAGILADTIDLWFRTGTAIPIPPGPIIPWT